MRHEDEISTQKAGTKATGWKLLLRQTRPCRGCVYQRKCHLMVRWQSGISTAASGDLRFFQRAGNRYFVGAAVVPPSVLAFISACCLSSSAFCSGVTVGIFLGSAPPPQPMNAADKTRAEIDRRFEIMLCDCLQRKRKGFIRSKIETHCQILTRGYSTLKPDAGSVAFRCVRKSTSELERPKEEARPFGRASLRISRSVDD
jgi:hypothetical protein